MDNMSPLRDASPEKVMVPELSPYGGKFGTSAYKLRLNGMPADEQNSPVRGKPMSSISEAVENPYPRGPPLTDKTNIHAGAIPISGGPKLYNGPLNYEDERELVQLFFEMIVNEKALEQSKMALAECADFNLVDAFSILDHKSLGWVSAP